MKGDVSGMNRQKSEQRQYVLENSAFLDRLFCHSMEQEYIRTLSIHTPFAAVLTFYTPACTMLNFSRTELLEKCAKILEESHLNGHAFLTDHGYFILLWENTGTAGFEPVLTGLREKSGISCVQYRYALSRMDATLSDIINAQITELSSCRYYGKTSGARGAAVSNKDLKAAVDKTSARCELGHYSLAAEVLREFVHRAHKSYCPPMSVKRSTLRIMYVFFPIWNNRRDENSYYDMPHFLIEQLLRADTREKTELLVERFAAYVLHAEPRSETILPDPIKRTLEYIQTNYSSPICLGEIADEIHLNKSYLSQLFQRSIGMSYSQYLKNMRIEEAKHLLRTTNMTVLDIAEHVGFSSQNYFTRVFKGEVNISPSQFRSVSCNTSHADSCVCCQ